MKTFIKTQICSLVLVVLYRALRVLVRTDSRVREDFESFPEGFTVRLALSEGGRSITFSRKDGRLVRTAGQAQADVVITFKSIDAAFLVFTGFMGITKAYAEHRFVLTGDIGRTMTLVRMIDVAESYLFPYIMTKRILRNVPKKQMSTLRVYRMTLLGV